MKFARAGLGPFSMLALLVPPGCAAQVEAAPCRALTFEGDPFTVCRAVGGEDEIWLSLKNAAGKPHRSLPALKSDLKEAAGTVRFAMNAGMYDRQNAPIGLYIENGRELKAVNTRDGFGNFHLKPNGVFWVDDDSNARVTTTDDFVAQKPKAAWASQSGPMLVTAGKLHPEISHDGQSRHTRNGVGIAPNGDALFVITDTPVSFGKLARLFRDELKAQDALYFDGAVSALWAPSLGRLDAGAELGPMVIVTSP